LKGYVCRPARLPALAACLHSTTLPVESNEPLLRRLLLILADTAVMFTPPEGRVTVAGSRTATAVTHSVADTGLGIAPDDLPRIFERFWRADGVRSRDSGGTGLGLAIARQIAEPHEAHLEARREVGRGSLLTRRLPRAAD
jgi:signal transduction histidine kinase